MDSDALDAAKVRLRADARARRLATPDRAERSVIIGERLRLDPAVVGAARVLAYSAMGSEVELASFVDWCVRTGREVRIPEDEVDASWPDVILVPGLAFTPDGRRCGQGAGWYDRFLPGRRGDCVTIGVGFSTQLVDDLPVGPHDVLLDRIVTD